MYTYGHLFRFISDLFIKTGSSVNDAETIAEVLLAAELRNIPSHGFVRIPDYINLYEKGRINPVPDIRIEHESPTTAVVNGDMAYGMVAGKRSMEIAIEKAKISGTGMVATKNSNHFGIAGYYSMMALSHDMIGITMTNANPLVAPTFSKDRMLGTNPIAVAIPALNQPPYVADFATTPIARGKLELLSKKGISSPSGFLQDKDGKPSNDPDILKRGGAMLPLGGDPDHGSHKGYCLGSMVDIFSAVLGGANFGPFVPPSVAYLPVLEHSTGEGTGHFFCAIRIDGFQPAHIFKAKMDEWIETFRRSGNIDGMPSVKIPGDIEREAESINMKAGINILPKIEEEVREIANRYSVEF